MCSLHQRPGLHICVYALACQNVFACRSSASKLVHMSKQVKRMFLMLASNERFVRVRMRFIAGQLNSSWTTPYRWSIRWTASSKRLNQSRPKMHLGLLYVTSLLLIHVHLYAPVPSGGCAWELKTEMNIMQNLASSWNEGRLCINMCGCITSMGPTKVLAGSRDIAYYGC